MSARVAHRGGGSALPDSAMALPPLQNLSAMTAPTATSWWLGEEPIVRIYVTDWRRFNQKQFLPISMRNVLTHLPGTVPRPTDAEDVVVCIEVSNMPDYSARFRMAAQVYDIMTRNLTDGAKVAPNAGPLSQFIHTLDETGSIANSCSPSLSSTTRAFFTSSSEQARGFKSKFLTGTIKEFAQGALGLMAEGVDEEGDQFMQKLDVFDSATGQKTGEAEYKRSLLNINAGPPVEATGLPTILPGNAASISVQYSFVRDLPEDAGGVVLQRLDDA